MAADTVFVPYAKNIRHAGLTIHDPIEIGDSALWIPAADLERLLDRGLRGISLAGMPPRTRSKVAKQHVCRVLGYPIPTSFPKKQPRFTGQCFDTYVQKANNLQVWNEALSPTRRYVLIRPSPEGLIIKVRVVTGDMLAALDATGRLTQKYQASFVVGADKTELVVSEDTGLLRPLTSRLAELRSASPVGQPTAGALLPIAELCSRLSALVGLTFDDAGIDQDRNRGARLHRLVCQALGYANYQDDGRFPDVRQQLLEVKLQTSRTIDLGLILPSSNEPLDMPKIARRQLRPCDVRYAIFHAHTNGSLVTLTHVAVTTGEAFFERFPQFQGKVLNQKLQIRLPAAFF
jgi:hypothetical protein